MNKEERLHHRRECIDQELLCTWPLPQFYSVRTLHEMDDILDVKKCLQKCPEFNTSLDVAMSLIFSYHDEML